MKNLKSIVTFCLSAAFVLMFALFSFHGRGSTANAADYKNLVDIADSFSILSVTDKDNNNIYNNDSTLYYGDNFFIQIKWWYLSDPDLISKEDIITYTLPSDVYFPDIPEAEKQEVEYKGGVSGYYWIENNTVYIQYNGPAADSFIEETQRDSTVMIKGSVNTDSQGTKVAEKRTITFEKAGEVTFNMEPVPQNADMEIHNRIKSREDSLTSHIYTQNVSFTSHGVNENIEFNIEMYPGMYLNEMGALYDSSGNLVDSSRYQIDYNVTKVHDPNGEKGNGRFVKINIGSMSDGETFVWRGTVGVIPDMYEENTANTYINSDTSIKEKYPNQYEGRVDNRAYVKSDQTLAGDQAGTSGSNRTDGLRTSWANVITLRGSFNKWACPEHNKDGYLCWEIVVYTLEGTDYTSGCIEDTFSSDTTFVTSKIETRDNVTGDILEGYITPSEPKDNNDGTTTITLNFTDKMINHLKADSNAGVIIRYYTKINRQAKDKETYNNNAQIILGGTRGKSKSTDVSYEKSDELVKTYNYEPSAASYVDFGVIVNPDTFDLDPDTNDILFEDVMSDSFDLVLGSVKVNNVTLSENEYTYDPSTRKMTIKLNDEKAYLIEYKAKINLMPGSVLDTTNGGNTVKLYGKTSVLYEFTKYVEETVYESSASSSSVTGVGIINITKHDKSSTTDVLSGAKFSLTPMLLDSSRTATVDSSMQVLSGTTDVKGIYSFGSLKRGKVYMLTEDEAPQGYELSTEPVFYAFKTSNITAGNITYNGKSYELNVIDQSKLSYEVYYANDKESKKTDETKPEETKPDDKTKDGSAVNVNDPSEETTTETTAEQATETTTEAPKNNTTAGGDNKSNTEVPAMGTTNVEEPKKDESSKPAETPKKEEAPRSSSSVRTGDGTLFVVVIVVMAVSFLAIVGIVMYKRKHDNE